MNILEVRDTVFWWVGCWTIITAADCAALSLALRMMNRKRRHWITPKGGEGNA